MAQTYINVLDCTTDRGNMGLGRCDYDMARDQFQVLMPKGEIVTAANLADWYGYLKGKLTHNNPLQRWFSIGPLKGATADGESVQYYTYDYDRSKVVTADPTDATIYTLLNKLCVAKNILDFDGCEGAFDSFYVDVNNICKFYQTTDPDTEAPALGGFSLDGFYVFPPDKATASTPALPKFRVLHNDWKGNIRNMAIIKMTQPMVRTSAEFAVQNVSVTNVTPGGAASGVIHLQLNSGCGTDNMAALYGSTMAVIGAFSMKNTATQAAITFTVALNAASTAFVFTLDTGDSDYPTPPATIDFNLASISALTALGISYYELPSVFQFAAT